MHFYNLLHINHNLYFQVYHYFAHPWLVLVTEDKDEENKKVEDDLKLYFSKELEVIKTCPCLESSCIILIVFTGQKTQTDEQTKTDAQENDKEEDCKEEYDTAELKRKSEEKVNKHKK